MACQIIEWDQNYLTFIGSEAVIALNDFEMTLKIYQIDEAQVLQKLLRKKLHFLILGLLNAWYYCISGTQK